LEDPGLYGKLILIWIVKEWGGGYGLDLFDSEQGNVVVFCECANELPIYIKFWKFLD